MKRMYWLIGVILLISAAGCNHRVLRGCEETYYVNGQKYTRILCAPQCPTQPGWRDVGDCPHQ